VVETSLCPRCSTVVPSDQDFCGRCGAPLAADPSLVSTDELHFQGDSAPEGSGAGRPRGKASPSAEAQSVAADRLAAALGFATLVEPTNSTAQPIASTTAGTNPSGLQPSGVSATRAAGSRANVTLAAQPSTSMPDPSPAVDAAPAVEHDAVPPLGSAAEPEPAPPLDTASELEPASSPSLYQVIPTHPSFSPFSPAPVQPAPVSPAPGSPPSASSLEPAPPDVGPEVRTTAERKESVQELVAFGLVAAGAVVGIASLFLPWGNATDGAGIAIDALRSRANEWGWSMSSAIPLLLLSALMLGAAYGSDRAKERIPKLAGVVGQVTDLILPMTLGGLYLGVVVMAATYPWGFGIGVAVMFVAAGLLIGGAVMNLFFPPKTEPDSH